MPVVTTVRSAAPDPRVTPCVKTLEENALAQLLNRMGGQRETLLCLNGSTRINLASKWFEICFRTAWVPADTSSMPTPPPRTGPAIIRQLL